MIPSPLYCVCLKCKQYSEYSPTNFTCGAGHKQPKTAFYTRKDDGEEFIFNCPSACAGGAVYSMGRCSACEEPYTKGYKTNLIGNPKPANFVELFDLETVNAHQEAVAARMPKRDDSLDPMCPVCGDRNLEEFVTDEDRVRAFGFSPTSDINFSDSETAEHGICISNTCIQGHGGHPYGVPLVDRKEWETASSETYDFSVFVNNETQPCNVEGCTGTYQATDGMASCDECGDSFELLESVGGKGDLRGDAYFRVRHKYNEALVGRKHIIDPPYYYTTPENPRAKSSTNRENGVPDPENMRTKHNHPDDWFNCLETYLRTLVKAVEYPRHDHLIASAYIDKTFRRGNVEPLWMYASERNGVGNSIEPAFKLASQCISVFQHTIDVNTHFLQPSKDSISVVYRMIKAAFGNLWPYSGDENRIQDREEIDSGLIEQAIAAWRRLERWEHYDQFWEVPMLRAPYNLTDSMTAAPGLVETICLLWSFKQKNKSVYKEIRNKVFPDGPSYWRKMLTNEGIQVIEMLDQVVFPVMDEHTN